MRELAAVIGVLVLAFLVALLVRHVGLSLSPSTSVP
jgi:hypothetical protein